jgi:hypothetical protein
MSALILQQVYDCFNKQLIIPEIAKKIGLEEAIVLSQVHYWLQKSSKVIDDIPWVYNTFEQWQQQFCYWSLSKVKRIFISLQNMGLLISDKKNKYLGCHTKWYTIDYGKFSELLKEIQPQKKGKASPSSFESSGYSIVAHIDNCQNKAEKGRGVKNFASSQDELSLVQIEPIITETTLPDINKCMSTKSDYQKKLKFTKLKRQTYEFSKEELEVSDKMLRVWKDIFLKEEKYPVLHGSRRSKMIEAYKRDFKSEMDKWREFCLSINSSKFLMGEKKEGFKAHFDWLLEEKTISKVLSKEFDIGDRVPDIEQEKEKGRKKEAEKRFQELRKQEEKRKREALEEELASKLDWERYIKMESSWTQEQHEEAKKAFERELYSEEDRYGVKHCRELFEARQWADPIINFAFTGFKRAYYLSEAGI